MMKIMGAVEECERRWGSLFEDHEYQMKDVMKLYGITRDAIKYYEAAGLIEVKRKENG